MMTLVSVATYSESRAQKVILAVSCLGVAEHCGWICFLQWRGGLSITGGGGGGGGGGDKESYIYCPPPQYAPVAFLSATFLIAVIKHV